MVCTYYSSEEVYGYVQEHGDQLVFVLVGSEYDDARILKPYHLLFTTPSTWEPRTRTHRIGGWDMLGSWGKRMRRV